MVIKDNFNKKGVDPLSDYSGIGKGSRSAERELELEKQGYIKANMDNKILDKLRDNSNNDDNNEPKGDPWKFFR